jgi:nucleoside phosphorylase/CheY-like chemotaxis protein
MACSAAERSAEDPLMSRSLRILVVEDLTEKYDRVRSLLTSRLASLDCEFLWAKSYNSAFRLLLESRFDVVILDLLIPLESGSTSPDNSRALMEMMLAGDLFPAAHIIGLTEFKHIAKVEKEHYAANMFALEIFSWSSHSWADRLAAKIDYLGKSKAASLQHSVSSYQSDILIIIARYENEYKPIVKRVVWQGPPKQGNPYFRAHECISGRMKVDGNVSLKVTLLCIGEMGNAVATAVTSQAINVFRPQLVCMLGMCCGFSSSRSASPALFGDVIVAKASASWEEGKYLELDDGSRFFRNRGIPKTVGQTIGPVISACVETAKDRILPLCANYIRSGEVRRLRRQYGKEMRASPEFKIGLIVSGSSVIADEKKVGEIIARQPNALGLDMEIFGVFTAAEKAIGNPPSVMAIKGVADFGTSGKHKTMQTYASVMSYYAFLGILRGVFIGGPLEPV